MSNDADWPKEKVVAIEQSEKRASKLGWHLLLAQLGIAFLVCLAIATFARVNNPLAAGVLIGFLFVQILLAAVWITLAPVSLFWRVLTASIAVFFFCFCMYLCAYRDGGGTSTAVSISGAMIAQWLLFQLPLWIVRWRGWKLVIAGTNQSSPNSEASKHSKAEFQFGIKHLVIWTTVIAIFITITKATVGNLAIEDLGELELLVYLTLVNSIIVLPIIWGGIARHYVLFWMTLGLILATAGSGIEFWFSGFPAGPYLIVAKNLTQVIFSILAMLAVRQTGYRLVQSPIQIHDLSCQTVANG